MVTANDAGTENVRRHGRRRLRLPRVRIRERPAEDTTETVMWEELAEVARLQRELRRARDRYELALATLETATGSRVDRSAFFPETVPVAAPSGREESISVQAASFEDLRGLGLSVTQAKRMIESRTRGTLRSVGDVDAVPGIPRAKRAQLKNRLRD